MTPGPGIEPGTHWWEACALTTARSLLPMNSGRAYCFGNCEHRILLTGLAMVFEML